MSKEVKKTLKKSFVRNVEVTKPKTVVIKDNEGVLPSAAAPPEKLRPEVPENTLGVPELNSALKIAKKIESLNNINPKKLSNTNFSRKKHTILEEKASKQVNFKEYQKNYKDLIPLCVNTQPQPIPVVARDYQIIKDEEPMLENFHTPKKVPEYHFQASIPMTHKVFNKQFDGFKMYRTMRNWN